MSEGVAARPDGPPKAPIFAMRFRCVMTTPLGADVDPDVNCTNATSVSDTAMASASPAPAASRMSYDATIDSAGQTARSESRCGARPADVMTARAAHDRNTAAVDSRYR